MKKMNIQELAHRATLEYVDLHFCGDDAGEKRHAYVIHYEAYCDAIRSVAQPIADERDRMAERIKALEDLFSRARIANRSGNRRLCTELLSSIFALPEHLRAPFDECHGHLLSKPSKP